MRKLLSLLCILLISVVSAQENQDVQNLLDSIKTKSGYPGIVFASVDKEGTTSTFVSGYADVENNILMTVDHKLHSGSTGKTVVSTLVLQLVEKGKISLDDKVGKYLGSNPWYGRLANSEEITIKNLLQHTSGIIRYEFKEAFLNELLLDADRVWKPEELLSFVFDDEPPFKAGEGFTYSDTNYILLGMIIEKITDEKFYTLARKAVLDPLGITSFSPTNKQKIKGMAQGYYTAGSEYALGFESPFLIKGKAQNNMQFEWTGGGYAYKTSDYARLLKKIFEGEAYDMELLGDELYDYFDAQEIGCDYGLGIMRFDFPGVGEVIGHAGFFPGYNSVGFYHPESKKAFSMQINSTKQEHLRPFFGDFIQLMRRSLK